MHLQAFNSYSLVNRMNRAHFLIKEPDHQIRMVGSARIMIKEQMQFVAWIQEMIIMVILIKYHAECLHQIFIR